MRLIDHVEKNNFFSNSRSMTLIKQKLDVVTNIGQNFHKKFQNDNLA